MPALENLYKVELDRRRETRRDAQRYRAFKLAGAGQPGVAGHLTSRIARAVSGSAMTVKGTAPGFPHKQAGKTV